MQRIVWLDACRLIRPSRRFDLIIYHDLSRGQSKHVQRKSPPNRIWILLRLQLQYFTAKKFDLPTLNSINDP